MRRTAKLNQRLSPAKPPWRANIHAAVWLNDRKRELSTVDVLLLTYNSLVALFILTFGFGDPRFTRLLLAHGLAFVLIGILAHWHARRRSGLARFVHSTYPLWALALAHYESGIINQLHVQGYFDVWFRDLDRQLFGTLPYLQLAPAVDNFWVDELMNAAYFAFYPIIIGVFIAMWRKGPRVMEEAVFVFASCMYGHFLLFIIFPVVGPTEARAALFDPQHGLFSQVIYYFVDMGDTPGGAFPSSHCSGSLVLACLLYKFYGGRPLMLVGPIVLLLWFSTVYLSFHYAVDSIGGLASGTFVFVTSQLVFLRLRAPAAAQSSAAVY